MNDDKWFKKIALITMTLSLVLIIFGKLMAEHILIAVVLLFQIALGYGGTLRRVPNPNPKVVNNNNNTSIILYTLMLSVVISSIEASLVSRNAAIITFILCYITFSIFVFLNKKEVNFLIQWRVG